MGKKLTNAPVFYTLAQVQFNHVLDLDGYIPAIQSKMREAHFPDFQKEVVQRLDFPMMGDPQGQLVPPTLTSQTRYIFGDIPGRTAFLLDTNVLTLQTTAYDIFEAFTSQLLEGLRMLHETLGLDFVERVGLRYLNAIQPTEGNTLRGFLASEVLGLALEEQGELQHSISETVIKTQAGQLVSRVVIRGGHVELPPDLRGVKLNIDPVFTQVAGLHAIVDTDATALHRDAFNLEMVKNRLTAIHDDVVISFNRTVTDHARDSWA